MIRTIEEEEDLGVVGFDHCVRVRGCVEKLRGVDHAVATLLGVAKAKHSDCDAEQQKQDTRSQQEPDPTQEEPAVEDLGEEHD